jgi:hypothetical protein
MNVRHNSRERENLETWFKCDDNVRSNFIVEGCLGLG